MSKLLGKGASGIVADFPLGTAGEAGVMISPLVAVRVVTCLVHIRAWGQWTAGTGATGVRARIHRGRSTSEGVVSETNLIPLYAAVGGVETMMLESVDWRQNAGGAQYYLTLEQEGALAAGVFLLGVMEVEVLSG